jgi:hypothetical protein
MAYDAQFFANLMTRVGVPDRVLPFVIAQIAHESNNFTSNLLNTHNNASGIVYNPKWQKNAQAGEQLPENNNYYYARFNTLNDWAKAYYHILKRKTNSPLDAINIEDYVLRLKAHNYFTDSVNNYLHGVRNFYNRYKNITGSAGKIIPLLFIGGLFIWLLSRNNHI